MMRRFLTVSTIAVLSNFGLMNVVQAGLFNQTPQVAALPKHNLILAQTSDIPPNPILAKTPANPNNPSSTDTPPLPTFAKAPTTPASTDTPPLPTFAKAPENPGTTNTPSADNPTVIPKPAETQSTPAVQTQQLPPQPVTEPGPTSDPTTTGTQNVDPQAKILPPPPITHAKTKAVQTLPAPSHMHHKHKHKHHYHHHAHKLPLPGLEEPKGLVAFTRYPIVIPTPHFKPANVLKPLIPFKGIAADGNIHVVVVPGKFRSVQIMNKHFSGDKLVSTSVSRGVLVLHDVSRDNLEEKAPRIIKVKVVTPTLGAIHLSGNSCLSAKNLAYNIVDIDTATSGYLKIRGNVCLHHILQRGRGPINIEWTNSDHIRIISTGPGPIHIAGKTDILNIRARDHADIDTKFLRANSGLIQTSENATVAVTVVDALSGFATGISNIFYYKTPRHLTRHTYDMGNVIQMNYWN